MFLSLKNQYPGALFRYVDALDHMDLAIALEVRETPTFVVWANGHELEKVVGAEIEELRNAVQAATNAYEDAHKALSLAQI